MPQINQTHIAPRTYDFIQVLLARSGCVHGAAKRIDPRSSKAKLTSGAKSRKPDSSGRADRRLRAWWQWPRGFSVRAAIARASKTAARGKSAPAARAGSS
jgi:hypothetical protein